MDKESIASTTAKYFDQRNDPHEPWRNCYINAMASLLSRSTSSELNNFCGHGQDLSNAIYESVGKFLAQFTSQDLATIGIKENAKVFRFLHTFWPIWVEKNFDSLRVEYKVMNLKEIYEYIKKHNLPVVCSTRLTTAGHIVCVTGVDITTKTVTCHDPWGVYPYKNKFASGKYAIYDLPKIFDKEHNCQVLIQ